MKKEQINLEFIKDLKTIIEESRKTVVKHVNVIMIQTYWNIGKRIVEEEQRGNLKAEYGSRLLKEISKELTNEYGRGFSKSNLFLLAVSVYQPSRMYPSL